ncbi:MAG: OmpA family protein [Terracidiphilus sp.]
MYLQKMKSVFLVPIVMSFALLPMGCKKAPPITLTAQATPPAVFPGEQVTVTATPASVSTQKKVDVVYDWSGTGVTGKGPSATVATDSLAPGSYTVKAVVKEGKPGKEGLKPGETADASASFTVKEFEPPTISCAANPTTINPGGSSTVTATGVSPQNRPLTYSYTASAGTISGTGTTATFNSAGAPSGSIGITCKVSDDKSHSASASTSVSITTPPPPPVPHTQALASISFDPKRPGRVNNEAKAALDGIALSLQNAPDAKLVVVGESTTDEKTPKKHHKHAKVEDLAAQRAVNVKDYLVTEKGIDASRISIATGTADSATVENYLVPAGANFAADVPGTTPVDETMVKPQARKPLGEKHHHHKKSAEAPGL